MIGQYFFKKLLELFLSLSLLVVLIFFLLKALPGGPFDDDIAMNPIVKKELSRSWNLESGSLTQAFQYYSKVLTGDLGVSMIRPEKSVASIISQGFKNTFFLNLSALVLVIIGSLGAALVWAHFYYHRIGLAIEQGTIALLSLPSLFLGPLLIYFFGFYLDLLPIAFLSSPLHYILPLVTLCLRPSANLTRILMTSLEQNMRQDYVRTAKAKGMGQAQILYSHVLRNSLVPFLSYLGPLIVSIFSGSFLVEVLFAVPGIGSEFVNSLSERDYTVIAGLTLLYGFLLIFINSLLDLVLLVAYPRLKEEAS